MRTVIFILLPFPSHYMACFEFARDFRAKGYNVVFAGTECLRGLVENDGFAFYPFAYLSEYSIRSFKSFVGLLLKTIVAPGFTMSRFVDFNRARLTCELLVERTTPVHLFIDEHLAEYYWFFKKYDCQITLVNTKLSTAKRKGVPPLDSAYLPTSTTWSDWYCRLLWARTYLKNRLGETLQKIAFLGRDEIFFWKRLCKANGYCWQAEISRNRCFYRGIKALKTIVLAPLSLDFPGTVAQANETHYYKKSQRSELEHITPEYEKIRDRIKNRRAGEHAIYIAFGTLTTQRDIEVIQGLITRLLHLAGSNSGLLLVLPRQLYPIGLQQQENVLLTGYVPQVDLLNYVDIMISAGGLGTIKECYQANVPMLLLPTNKKGDHPGNASRVQANGRGLRGDLQKEPIESIFSKIKQLLKIKKELPEVTIVN